MTDLDTAVYNALVAAAISGSHGTFHGRAKQGIARPYTMFNHVAGTPDGTNTTDYEEYLYDIVAVDDLESGSAVAGAMADDIDVVMHFGSLTISGWTHVETRRESRENRWDEDAWYIGGRYRIRITKAA